MGGGTLALGVASEGRAVDVKSGGATTARKSNRPLIAAILDTSILHEYSAVSSPSNITWVVDTGASYDVVPVGLVERVSLGRLPLKDPVGTTAASGRIYATHTVVSQTKGMPERVCAAEVQNSPSLISVGRRCLNHGYSFAWLVGKNTYFVAVVNP